MSVSHTNLRFGFESPILAAALLSLAALTPLATHAQQGATTANMVAAPEVIYACMVPGSGTIYRIRATDPNESCKSPNHQQFHWNVQGPAGDEGPEGPEGPVSFNTPHMHVSSGTNVDGNQFGVEATCESGEAGVAGGFALTGPAISMAHVQNNQPRHFFDPEGRSFDTWWVRVLKPAGVSLTITAYVVCVEPPA
jgi:hypothetical protein